MKVIIEIEIGNEAMQTPSDVADVLQRLALRVRGKPWSELDERISFGDINGNRVGQLRTED